MKNLFLFILASLFSFNSYSQNADSIRALADAAVNAVKWDIQKAEKGTLMFLDIPYQRDNSDSIEYLTLTVAKNKSDPRPAFISIIIPNNVVQANGIFVKFSKTVKKNGQWAMEMEKGNPVRVKFERCNDETCTARIINGYVSEEDGKQQDIFQKFLNFDHVLFLFIYPDGTHKSVAVPLFSFQEQYKSLD
ncbi:MAG: hypothetical protein JSS96_12875 [Bacteroidetes bacterium]|nr:hypothetical protein [Bacteroidota bacterium]